MKILPFIKNIYINACWTLKNTLKPARGKKGQIVIPSLFLIPAVMLFLYLIVETAKLSRSKIRHQFAVDAAAFVEMTNYSNFFNRTAYVNGVFPHRLAIAAFEDEMIRDEANRRPIYSLYDIFVNTAAFPVLYANRCGGTLIDSTDPDTADIWCAQFELNKAGGGGSNIHGDAMSRYQQLMQVRPKADLGTLRLTEEDGYGVRKYQATQMVILWDAMTSYYKIYAQIYMTLGDIQSAQTSVHRRLMEAHSLYRKSFYMNAATCDEKGTQQCTNKGAQSFETAGLRWSDMGYRASYVRRVFMAGRKLTNSLTPLTQVKTDPPQSMGDPGLFQLSSFEPSALARLKAQPGAGGVQVVQDWDSGSNFFRVNVNTKYQCPETPGKPCVKVRAGASCPTASPNNNNCVWPYTTPRYQTRTFPY